MAAKRPAIFLDHYHLEEGNGWRSRSHGRNAVAYPMLCLSGLLLFSGVYSLPVGAAEKATTPTADGPAIAYLYGGKLYCLHIVERVHDRPPPPKIELWKAKLTLEGTINKEKQPIRALGIVAWEGVLFRWRISHAFFWSAGEKAGDLAGFSGVPLTKLHVETKLQAEDFVGCRDGLLIPVKQAANRMRPVSAADKLEGDAGTPYAIKDAYYDFLPGDKNEILALLAWRGQIRVWRGIIQTDAPVGKSDDIKWDNAIPAETMYSDPDARPALRVRTEMREAFFAYQNKTHFFFVTVSGKLYACRKRGDKQRTELLWNDARSPIRAIIHDTASQKTFAFTKAAGRADKAGRDVWFELAAKLKPVAYDRKQIPELKLADPLPTMMEYARILLWNVAPADWRVTTGELTAQQHQQWWTDLTSTEAVKAHRAAWSLAARGADTVVFLKDHLHPVPAETQKHLDQLLADLDSDTFDSREAATRELCRGVVAESALRKTLAHSPSLERRRRLEAILEDLPDWTLKNPELLRNVRAIWVLQRIGTPEARALLEKLAAGAPSARQTQRAKDALQSLDHLKKHSETLKKE